MLGSLRQALRNVIPAKAVHAYRVARHTILWPTEREMVASRQFLSSEQAAIDVGAHFGLFTSVLARHCKTVTAFEPNPNCASYLGQVLPHNCEVIAKAVSDIVGMATLRLPVSGSVILDALATIETANQFETEVAATQVVAQTVETVTLDQIILAAGRSSNRVSFINIDAEGHEFAVLRGGQGLLSSHRPVLLVELEYRHGAAVADIFAWLKAQQYTPRFLISGCTLAPIDPAKLRDLQSEEGLRRRLVGNRNSGYVNNVFFLPED